MSEAFLGIDVGGTNIKYGVVSEDGAILQKHSIPTKAHEGRNAVISRIQQVASELLGTWNPEPGTWNMEPGTKDDTWHVARGTSIGICVPGVVDPITRCVQSPPNLPGWDSVDLVQELNNPPLSEGEGDRGRVRQEGDRGRVRQDGDRGRVRFIIENDANAAALAEHAHGAGKGHSNFLYVTLGTGIGGGIIINDKLFVGPNGGDGEIGHIDIDVREPARANTRPFRTGVLEELAGNAGIVKRFVNASKRTDIVDVEAISMLAEGGDSEAIQTLEETGLFIGLALCSAFSILDFSLAVIGGGVSKSDVIINAINKTIRERSLPTIARNAKAVRAHFLADAGLVGAAMLNRLSLPLQT